jgi:hypothetical protein
MRSDRLDAGAPMRYPMVALQRQRTSDACALIGSCGAAALMLMAVFAADLAANEWRVVGATIGWVGPLHAMILRHRHLAWRGVH